MLLEKDKSCLLLVDVQEKLAPLVKEYDAVLARCEWLLRLAHSLNVPILASEQYPQGLGATVKALQEFISDAPIVSKVHFSCFKDPSFLSKWKELNKRQAVIIGIETHVCILQTALEMKEAGMDVYVVVDAVSSRHEHDQQTGLSRLKANGIHLVTAEMVFFEWLRQAGTPEFKQLSQIFLR